MIDLHDSHGRHIANFVSGQLHDVQGRNIGHYLENEGIFINMQGYYFYQIVDKRRLLYNNNSAINEQIWKIAQNYTANFINESKSLLSFAHWKR